MGSQAAQTQLIWHGHAQESKQSAQYVSGTGQGDPNSKKNRGGDSQKGYVSARGRLAASPTAPTRSPTPQLSPYPCQSSQRQRPRFRRRNGARRSPNRRFVCGPAAATEQPARLPRPLLPPTTPWCRPGSPELAPHGRPTTRDAACLGLPPPRCRPRPRKRREPCTSMQKKNLIDGPKPTARPPPAASRGGLAASTPSPLHLPLPRPPIPPAAAMPS